MTILPCHQCKGLLIEQEIFEIWDAFNLTASLHLQYQIPSVQSPHETLFDSAAQGVTKFIQHLLNLFCTS